MGRPGMIGPPSGSWRQSGIVTRSSHRLTLTGHQLELQLKEHTGKTFNSAFVEFALTPHQAGLVAQSRNLKVLKGRLAHKGAEGQSLHSQAAKAPLALE
ncbi:hypothetical protein DFQ26_008996 [Actinomortierella ambigua]|nr:hypothetical protein DFQ26_008996 [Actinomortierella ambigua]